MLEMDTLAAHRALRLNDDVLKTRGHARVLRPLLTDGVPGPAWARLVERSEAVGDADVFAADVGLGHQPASVLTPLLAQLHPVPVRVVLTARPLTTAVPALWVERLRTGGETRTLGEFSAAALSDDDPTGATMPALDWVVAVTKWSGLVGPENVTVVTLPGAATGAFRWQRFCEALGLDPHGLQEPPERARMGAVTAEIMRRVNLRAQTAGTPVRHAIRPRRKEPQLVLAQKAFATCQALTDDRIAALVDSGVAVVGDVADLIPAIPPAGRRTTSTPEQLSSEQLLATAIHDLIDLATPLQPSATTLA